MEEIYRKPICLDLADSEASDQAVVGGKAANLNRLIKAGLPVPPGWVVIPGSIKGCNNTWLGSVFNEDPRLAGVIYGREVFAVRSSAAVEDGSRMSFAGQFKSYLNVAGDNLVKMASYVVGGRPNGHYYEAMKSDFRHEDVRINVVIQRMVFATRAVVGFTINPVSGERRETVEVVKGNGEILVSGKTTPAVWEVGQGGLERVFGPDIDVPESDTLLGYMRKCREVIGAEADVEAAYDDVQWWILQARPITT